MRLLPLLLAGLLAAGACSDPDPPPAPTTTTAAPTSTSTSTTAPPTSVAPTVVAPSPAVIGFLGDSLLHQARDEVAEQFPGKALVIESAPGLETFDARYAVDDLRDAGVGTLGIVLGTNNARDGFEDRDLRVLEGIVRATSFASCVRWVTVTETTPDARLNDAARRINDGLADLAAGRDTLELVDWAGAIAAHPEWLAADGLHHTPAGQAVLADMLADALRACPAREA